MVYHLGCDLRYRVQADTVFLFNVAAAERGRQQILEEQIELEPQAPLDTWTDPHSGNRLLRVRGSGNDATLSLTYRAKVETSHRIADASKLPAVPLEQLPHFVLPYLNPSRYCQSDKLLRMAGHHFGGLEPGFTQVAGVCNWIYDNVEYLYGSSDTSTSAFDTATERAGVCRDFAHLAIAFCRALNLPARFTAGYACGLDPADFHACFEVWIADGWWLFDATRRAPQTGFVRIGTGRDAADVSFCSIFGAAEMQEMKVWSHSADGQQPQFVTDPVAISKAD